jgi:hypothetical protein
MAKEARQSADMQFELHMNVRGEQVDFATGLTDRRGGNGDGINQEAINVCWRAKSGENGSVRDHQLIRECPGKSR